MKRVQLRPGRSVFVSSTLLEQATRAFAKAAFTCGEVKQMVTSEPKHLPTVLLGPAKAPKRALVSRVRAKSKARSSLVVHNVGGVVRYEGSKPKRKVA